MQDVAIQPISVMKDFFNGSDSFNDNSKCVQNIPSPSNMVVDRQGLKERRLCV